MSVSPTISQIIRAVAHFHGVPEAVVRSGRRGSFLSEPGQIACYLAHRLTLASPLEIGTAFGGCLQTAIWTAVGQVTVKWREDLAFRETVEDLRLEILAETRALQMLGGAPPADLDPVALATEVSSGRLPVTGLSTTEIFAIASGLAALARSDGAQPQEASNAR